MPVAFPTHTDPNPRSFNHKTGDMMSDSMNRIAIALAVASATFAFSLSAASAQQFDSAPSQVMASASPSFQAPEAKPSVFRRAVSEVAILRYRTALKLTAAQEKYWPAAAAALRALTRQAQIDEAVVRRYAPAMRPLIASLDDHQKQVAMGLAQQAGLAQYASLF